MKCTNCKTGEISVGDVSVNDVTPPYEVGGETQPGAVDIIIECPDCGTRFNCFVRLEDCIKL